MARNLSLIHRFLIASVLSSTILPSITFATATFSLQGRIIKPSGGVLEIAGVQFDIRVLSPDANSCILYEETQTKDLTGSGGLFNISLNDGSGTRSDGLPHPFEKTFSNQAPFNVPSAKCGAGAGTVTYTPGPNDERTVLIYFREPGAAAWEQMPPMTLSHSSFAIEAGDSLKVGGFAASNMCRVVDGSGNPAAAAAFTSAQFNELLSVANGNYTKTSSNGSIGVPVVSGNPGSGLAAGQMWYDSAAGQLKFYDGAVKTVGTSGGSVTSVSAGTGLTGGPITSSGSLAVDVGTTAGKIVQVQTGGKLPALDGSNLTSISASSIAGTSVTGTPASSSQVLKYNGTTAYAPGFIGVADIRSTVAGNAQFIPTNCTASQTLVWQAPSDVMACTTIAVTASNFASQSQNTVFAGPSSGGAGAPSFRTIASADLPLTGANGIYANGGNSFGTGASIGTNDANTLTLQTNNTARMTLDTSGNVGIGIATPGYKLDVNGPVRSNKFMLGSDLSLIPIAGGQSAVSSWWGLQLVGNKQSNVDYVPSNIGLIDDYGVLIPNQQGSKVALMVRGAAGQSGDLFQAQNNSGTSLVNISSSGSVGIGAASPTANLQINGAPNSDMLYLQSANYGAGNKVSFKASTYATGGNSATDRISFIDDGNFSGHIVFETAPGASAGTVTNERMRISSTGNVGIGTASPVAKLQVGAAPPASPNYPLFALGNGAFDGTTAGFFTGNTNGTFIGVNAATGFTGDLANLQIGGVSKFKVDSSGNITSVGTTSSSGNYSTAGNISTTGAGTITSAGGLTVSSGGANLSGGITNNSGGIVGAGNITGVGANLTGAGAMTVAAGGTAQNLTLNSSTSGSVNLGSGNGTSLSVLDGGASTVNYVTMKGAATGAGPTIATAGADANIHLLLAPKGTGNVGVGVSSPVSKFDVSTTSGTAAQFTGSFIDAIVAINSPIAKGSQLAFRKSVTNGTRWTVESNSTNETGSDAGSNFAISRYSDAGVTTSTPFFIRRSDGFVGIGTSSPSAQLHVAGSETVTGALLVSTGSTAGTDFNLANTDTGGATWLLRSTGSAATGGAGNLRFDQPSGTPRMLLSSAGNLGIGTTAPAANLDVVGTSTASSGAANAISSNLTFSPAAGSTATARGLNFLATFNGLGNSSGAVVVGVAGTATNSWTGRVGTLYGVNGFVGAINGGTTDQAYGGFFQVQNTASTVTSAYGVYTGIVQGTNKWSFYANDASAPSYFAGNVGIGTTTPATALQVTGSIVSTSNPVATTVTTIDWSKGNIQYTPDSCGAFTFNNILDGGSYTFVVKGGTSATCTFTSAGLTYHFTPANGATTAATHTMYSFFRAGTDVYVSWVSGM